MHFTCTTIIFVYPIVNLLFQLSIIYLKTLELLIMASFACLMLFYKIFVLFYSIFFCLTNAKVTHKIDKYHEVGVNDFQCLI